MSKSFKSWKTRGDSSSFLLIALWGFFQYSLLLIILKFLLPSVWKNQLTAGFGLMLFIFLFYSLIFCFVEFFFHRYGPHAFAGFLLRGVAVAHVRHHSLTSVLLVKDGELERVKNNYFIIEDKQHESVALHPYSLPIFFAFYTPSLALFQLLFSHTPFLIGGYFAATCYFILYSIFHVIEHLPDSWWQKKRRNLVLRYMQKFHQYHHVNTDCNMAIVGFFGLPLADWLFGTAKMLDRVLLDGMSVTQQELLAPKPCRFIQKLDQRSQQREARLLREWSQIKNHKVIN